MNHAAPLLTDEELARLRLQTLTHWQHGRRRATLTTPGPFPVPLRGQGLDLHDRRPYQPGDDVRHLDWRATARSSRPYTKIFLEERGRSLFLLIDRRPGMRFGSRTPKAASAARIAAILAFTALQAGERVGGLVLEDAPRIFPPAGTLTAVMRLLRCAAAPFGEETPPPSLRALWHDIARRCGPGTELCLICDGSDPDEFPPAVLRAIVARHTVHAFQIRDPGELTLPALGWLQLRAPGGDTTALVDTHEATLRQRYREAVAACQARFQNHLAEAGVSLRIVYNHRDAFEQLTASCHAGTVTPAP